jgi:antitoxin ParD1/3/4
VQAQIEEGKYASSSDYVRDLIRKDQQARDKLAALQAAITLSMESGQAGDLDMDMESNKHKARQLAGLDTA